MSPLGFSGLAHGPYRSTFRTCTSFWITPATFGYQSYNNASCASLIPDIQKLQSGILADQMAAFGIEGKDDSIFPYKKMGIEVPAIALLKQWNREPAI